MLIDVVVGEGTYIHLSFILQYHIEIQLYEDTLESLMFTTDVETHILQVFQRFKSVKS